MLRPRRISFLRPTTGTADVAHRVSVEPERIMTMSGIRIVSVAAWLNVAGLVLTAAGMLLQIAGGSVLYPSIAGPIVLVVAAIIVTFVPGHWTGWIGLIVPLALGLGAIIAALMTGAFIAQLTDAGRLGILIGSLMQVIGLVAAVSGGVGMVMQPARTTP